MTALRVPVELDAHADVGVRNSQPEGIGRVAVVGDVLAWNNLGRNVVFAGFDRGVRAVFGDTVFPGQDEPSQYDLDVHAVVGVGDSIVVVNHLGMARSFAVADIDASAGGEVAPGATAEIPDDMERIVGVGDLLVGSCAPDDSQGGVVVTDLRSHEEGMAGWGQVTALAASEDGRSLAVGGDGRVAIAPIEGRIVGPIRWETSVPFACAWLEFDRDVLWVAGSGAHADVDDHDWDSLGGGGFARLALDDGTISLERSLRPAVAWGNGGVAVGRAADVVWAVDRRGAVHFFDTRDGEPLGATAPVAPTSLGIAHAATVGDRVVFGFNRAGYRLFAAQVPVRTRRARVE